MRKILISPGFGAGWSTWADDELQKDMLFDEKLIEAVENEVPLGDEDAPGTPLGDFVLRMKEKHGKEVYFYTGGARDLRVVEVNGRFRVTEYDGHEDIITDETAGWIE